MKKIYAILVVMSVGQTALAADPVPELVLDKIQFQVSSKQWVSTQTALLSVNINVTLNNADLVKARSEIMSHLNSIAKGDWHLIQFDRSQDNSGLEKLYVQAQARVDQSALTAVYQNAKTASVPGAQYEIGGVEFKPSLEETQVVRAKIREQLYQKVNEEMVRINKVYPTQNYTVNNLVFVEGEGVSVARDYQAKQMNTMAMAAAPVPLTVSNELVMTVVVDAASNRKQGN